MARNDHDPRVWKILQLYDFIASLADERKAFIAKQKGLKIQALDEILDLRAQLEGTPRHGKSGDLFTVHQGERLVGYGRNKQKAGGT